MIEEFRDYCYRCKRVKTKTDIQMFLNFPNTLYDDDNPRNKKEEKQLITGKHSISPDIEFYPYIVLDSFDLVVCRGALTYYKNDNVAYLGFFDSVGDKKAAQTLFDMVEDHARQNGKTKIVGPIDASIYINYRFKTNEFNNTYTGEPYNRDYYASLWMKNQYKIAHTYVSNQLRQVTMDDSDEKLARIRDKFENKNVRFVNLSKKKFEKSLVEIYELLMDLYSCFPGYKKITKEQFVALYSPLKKIYNESMVKLAYRNGRLSAFAIAIPNYNTLTRGRLTVSKIIRMHKKRQHPSEYVILYVGAEKASAGLGCAIMQELFEELTRNGCTSIGALIKEGNLTNKIYKHVCTKQYKYVLLEKQIV